MSGTEPNGTLSYRMASLERRVEKIEHHEPAVVVRDIKALSGDLQEFKEEIKEEVAALRRVLIGFLVAVALVGVTTSVTILSAWPGG